MPALVGYLISSDSFALMISVFWVDSAARFAFNVFVYFSVITNPVLLCDIVMYTPTVGMLWRKFYTSLHFFIVHLSPGCIILPVRGFN